MADRPATETQTEVIPETAAEYLRAAAAEVRQRASIPGRVAPCPCDNCGYHLAVAAWLDDQVHLSAYVSLTRNPLEVAAAVLGRTWPS